MLVFFFTLYVLFFYASNFKVTCHGKFGPHEKIVSQTKIFTEKRSLYENYGPAEKAYTRQGQPHPCAPSDNNVQHGKLYCVKHTLSSLHDILILDCITSLVTTKTSRKRCLTLPAKRELKRRKLNSENRQKPPGTGVHDGNCFDLYTNLFLLVHIDLTKLPDCSSKPTEFWLQKLDLFPSDKRSISEGQWLSDNVITAAQFLIKKKFPDIKGLQSPLLGETLTFDVHPAGVEFVQVLNVSNSHWITVTSIGCSSSEIKVYDSFPSCDVSSRVKQQIATLINSKEDKIKVVIPHMCNTKAIVTTVGYMRLLLLTH